MGPEDNNSRDLIVYLGDTPIGKLSVASCFQDLTPDKDAIEVYDGDTGDTIALLCASETGGTLTLHFTAVKWAKCKSRKRFIKMMAGAFGMQRNEAAALATAAMRAGCPSYQDLWADCYAYFVQYAVELSSQENAEPPSGLQDKSTRKE